MKIDIKQIFNRRSSGYLIICALFVLLSFQMPNNEIFLEHDCLIKLKIKSSNNYVEFDSTERECIAPLINYTNSLMEDIRVGDTKSIHTFLSNHHFSNKGLAIEQINENLKWASEVIGKATNSNDVELFISLPPYGYIDKYETNVSSVEYRYKDSRNNYDNTITFSFTVDYLPKRENLFVLKLLDIRFIKSEMSSSFLDMLINYKEATSPFCSLDSLANGKVGAVEINEWDLEDLDSAMITKLHHVDSLKVDGCHVGVVPEFVKGLRQLKYLDLSSNQIISIPSWFCELDKLEELNLSYNKISKVPNCILGNNSLQILQLQWNSINKNDVKAIKSKANKTLNIDLGQQE
jgi:hypothetical protein